MDNLPLWLVFTITTSAAVFVGVMAQFFLVPWQRKRILSWKVEKPDEIITEKPSPMENGFTSSVTTINTISTTSLSAPAIKDMEHETEENVNHLFSFLQILAAIFSSFAHGGNDVR